MTERATLSVGEAAKLLGIGRGLAYELVRQGQLPALKLGRRIVVPRLALEQLLEGKNGSHGKVGVDGEP